MLENKMILIIDDDKGVRELLEEFLRLYGFQAHSVNNGISALNLLKKEYFDIIITDYSIPGMNGIDLTKIVRLLYPHALIIGISGTHCDGKDFLTAGADTFLSKPFQLQELLSLCKSKI